MGTAEGALWWLVTQFRRFDECAGIDELERLMNDAHQELKEEQAAQRVRVDKLDREVKEEQAEQRVRVNKLDKKQAELEKVVHEFRRTSSIRIGKGKP